MTDPVPAADDEALIRRRSRVGAISGTRLRPERPVETYGVGRVCVDEACTTVLSRYNEGPGCAIHRIYNKKPRVRGERS